MGGQEGDERLLRTAGGAAAGLGVAEAQQRRHRLHLVRLHRVLGLGLEPRHQLLRRAARGGEAGRGRGLRQPGQLDHGVRRGRGELAVHAAVRHVLARLTFD